MYMCKYLPNGITVVDMWLITLFLLGCSLRFPFEQHEQYKLLAERKCAKSSRLPRVCTYIGSYNRAGSYFRYKLQCYENQWLRSRAYLS